MVITTKAIYNGKIYKLRTEAIIAFTRLMWFSDPI